MHHVAGPGDVHWYWVLYNVPAGTTNLPTNVKGVGTLGNNSVDSKLAYSPPCSKGPGRKTYTYTVFALSAAPQIGVDASAVTRDVLLAAIQDRTLSSATLTVTYNRSGDYAATTAAPACQERIAAFRQANEQVSAWCDDKYLYVESTAFADHVLMVGITSWNQQVPTPQFYSSSNAWQIPLSPVLADTPSATNGQDAIGLAINGVPIFDPTRQDGVYSADADPLLIGEVDVCGGHSGRAEDYHYHAAPTCMIGTLANPNGAVIGYGLAGFPIRDLQESSGATPVNLDRCNGHDHDGLGYHYHATTQYPYLMGCYRGIVNTRLQPKTHAMRDPGQPVQAQITGFDRADDGWIHLSYVYAGVAGETAYRKVNDTCYEFQYTNPPPGSPSGGAASQTACPAIESPSSGQQPPQQPGTSGQPGQPGGQPGPQNGQQSPVGTPPPTPSANGAGQPGQTGPGDRPTPPPPPPPTPTR